MPTDPTGTREQDNCNFFRSLLEWHGGHRSSEREKLEVESEGETELLPPPPQDQHKQGFRCVFWQN